MLYGKYVAKISIQSYEHHLGVFTDYFEACCCRASAENFKREFLRGPHNSAACVALKTRKLT